MTGFVFVYLYITSLNLYCLSPGQRWRVSPLVVCVPVAAAVVVVVPVAVAPAPRPEESTRADLAQT